MKLYLGSGDYTVFIADKLLKWDLISSVEWNLLIHGNSSIKHYNRKEYAIGTPVKCRWDHFLQTRTWWWWKE